MHLFPHTGILLLCLLLSCASANAHNITRILAKHPDFSTFNHYLTLTHLAPEINRHTTITVLAIDNSAMSAILAKHYSLFAIKNILSLHILLDYFGAKKLHQITNGTALSATLFQATGSAAGSSGFVNITDLKAGKVGFGAEDNGGVLDATYVKSLQEIPYNISVIQISQVINSPAAEAPTPEPSKMNLTAVMAKQGCKMFGDLLTASGAAKSFDDAAGGGLTVFCPVDGVMKGFMPKYKNLTAKGKISLLLYHGVPVYYSIQMLKSNNGAMNTLATDGGSKFDFTVQNDGEEVTLRTKVTTAKITGTVIDMDPLAIYTVDKVLQPKELFKAPAPAPAPAPEPSADAPTSKKKKKLASPPAPAGPEEQPADQTAADDSGGVRGSCATWIVGVLGLWLMGLAV